MAHPLRSVRRAALFGLAMGLLCAAVVLLVFAWQHMKVDCAGLSAAECGLEKELARSIARLQVIAALGCTLVGAGLVLLLPRP
ncbi:MAG: hypothetical protein IT380_19865 [Myxococcales bacterium]|nr:hypothetical protein [Myxococcales bacterium]